MTFDPITLRLYSNDWPDKGLTLDEALKLQPYNVQQALYAAVCYVGANRDDAALLHLKLAFRDSLATYRKENDIENDVLEACRQGMYAKDCLEYQFYYYGKELAIIALSVAIKTHGRLYAQIEALPMEKRIELIKFITRVKKTKIVEAWIKEFRESPSNDLTPFGLIFS